METRTLPTSAITPQLQKKNKILLQHNSAVQIMQLVTNLVRHLWRSGPAPLLQAPLRLYQIWSILVRETWVLIFVNNNSCAGSVSRELTET